MGDEARRAGWAKPAAIWAASTAAAIGLFLGYRWLFPFRSAAHGVCIACGARTRLGPGGWADFCPRHNPLTPLPPLMVIAEAASLLSAAISGWFLLRRLAHLGGRTVSLALVLLCVAAMLLYALAVREPLHPAQHFTIAIFLLVYVLSAAYVDGVESLIMVTSVTLIVAAILCFVIQLMTWLLMGYCGFFAPR